MIDRFRPTIKSNQLFLENEYLSPLVWFSFLFYEQILHLVSRSATLSDIHFHFPCHKPFPIPFSSSQYYYVVLGGKCICFNFVYIFFFTYPLPFPFLTHPLLPIISCLHLHSCSGLEISSLRTLAGENDFYFLRILKFCVEFTKKNLVCVFQCSE